MERSFRTVRPSVIGFLLLLLAAPTFATTLRKLSFEELVDTADTIVHGTCTNTEVVWLDKKIYTVATVSVADSAKGAAAKGSSITIYLLGGRVREPIPVEMYVPGAPTMQQGEEAVLFLERGEVAETGAASRRVYRLVGMAQGKIPVVTDAQSGRKEVRYGLPVKGVNFVEPSSRSTSQDAQQPSPEPPKEGSLEGFLGRIQHMEAEKGAEGKEDSKESQDSAGEKKGGGTR